jgi:kynureninase
VLQYLGHGVGSIAFVVILLIISSSGRLEQWYGHDAVQRARSRRFDRQTQIKFWVIATTPVVLVAIASVALGRSPLFACVTASAFSMLATGAAFGSPISVDDDQLPGVTSPVS